MEDTDIIVSELLENIKPKPDDFIYRRLKNRSFAQTIITLCAFAKTQEYIMVKDIREVLGYSQQRANQILHDFANNGLLKKNKKGDNWVEYEFKRDDETGIFLIAKYLEPAKRVLGLKMKITFK